MCACMVGQAPWKQQQRSSAFKWIKTPAQSPGPAAIGQAGCSLDEDLRLIISRAAFVFAATVACTGKCRRGERRAAWGLSASLTCHASASPTLGCRALKVYLMFSVQPAAPSTLRRSGCTQNSVCHAHTSGDTSAPN